MSNQFCFLEFEPSSELKHSSKLLLESILDHSPSDATPVARLAKKKGGFEATIEIFSQAGYFVGRSFEKTAETALTILKQRVEDRLSQWKQWRFSDSAEEQQPTIPHAMGQPGGIHGTHPH